MERRTTKPPARWVGVDAFERAHPGLVLEEARNPRAELAAHAAHEHPHPTHMNHASPHNVRTPRSTRVAVAVALTLFGASVVRAEAPLVDRAAVVEQTAERIVVSGRGTLFPIEPTPMCEVLDNFGGYSKTFGSGGHQGVDIGARVGQEVYAVEDGVLYRQFTDLGRSAGLGWGLHSDTDTKYRYYHLDGFAEGLSVGDRVEAGQLIGYVGDTGNATPGGWHLHFEVRPGPAPHRRPVDPVPLLDIPTICNVY
jgi:murein DD-endopeptidase MepM/ murein hydrolase activator NlpD